jgi:hypothetical protein
MILAKTYFPGAPCGRADFKTLDLVGWILKRSKLKVENARKIWENSLK